MFFETPYPTCWLCTQSHTSCVFDIMWCEVTISSVELKSANIYVKCWVWGQSYPSQIGLQIKFKRIRIKSSELLVSNFRAATRMQKHISRVVLKTYEMVLEIADVAKLFFSLSSCFLKKPHSADPLFYANNLPCTSGPRASSEWFWSVKLFARTFLIELCGVKLNLPTLCSCCEDFCTIISQDSSKIWLFLGKSPPVLAQPNIYDFDCCNRKWWTRCRCGIELFVVYICADLCSFQQKLWGS